MIKNRISHSINCNHCNAKNVCISKDLPAEDISYINSIINNMKVLSKGEYAFHANDEIQFLYAVHSGSCKDYWLDENGNQHIDNFYFPGDVIGMESISLGKHLFSLSALEDTQLCMIPIKELFLLMQSHPSILRRIINIASNKMQNDQYLRMTTNATQRIADFIINIHYRLHERKKHIENLHLPMSQIDISHYLGMAHETVNRILNKLQDEMVISLNNKKIYIIDISTLEKLASPLKIPGLSTDN